MTGILEQFRPRSPEVQMRESSANHLARIGEFGPQYAPDSQGSILAFTSPTLQQKLDAGYFDFYGKPNPLLKRLGLENNGTLYVAFHERPSTDLKVGTNTLSIKDADRVVDKRINIVYDNKTLKPTDVRLIENDSVYSLIGGRDDFNSAASLNFILTSIRADLSDGRFGWINALNSSRQEYFNSIEEKFGDKALREVIDMIDSIVIENSEDKYTIEAVSGIPERVDEVDQNPVILISTTQDVTADFANSLNDDANFSSDYRGSFYIPNLLDGRGEYSRNYQDFVIRLQQTNNYGLRTYTAPSGKHTDTRLDPIEQDFSNFMAGRRFDSSGHLEGWGNVKGQLLWINPNKSPVGKIFAL